LRCPRRSPLWGKVHMAQFSVKIMRLTGSLLGENQQAAKALTTDRSMRLGRSQAKAAEKESGPIVQRTKPQVSGISRTCKTD
ncbi:MAG: hypothetical protein ACK4GC_05945, partial [Paracoccaceae bacterium]